MQFKCPKCSGIIDDGANFCKHCGQKITWPSKEAGQKNCFCSKCGKEYDISFAFCPFCGFQNKAKASSLDSTASNKAVDLETFAGEYRDIAMDLFWLPYCGTDNICEYNSRLAAFLYKVKVLSKEDAVKLYKYIVADMFESIMDKGVEIHNHMFEEIEDIKNSEISIYTWEEIYDDYYQWMLGLVEAMKKVREEITAAGVADSCRDEICAFGKMEIKLLSLTILPFAAEDFDKYYNQMKSIAAIVKQYEPDYFMEVPERQYYPSLVCERSHLEENIKKV